MMSKEASEQALLIEKQGRCTIKGGNIKQVYFLPNGDKWQVSRGGALSIVSNYKRLTQTIGLDRTRAIQEAERELDLLRIELRNAEDDGSKVKREREDYKRNWQQHNNSFKANDAEIKTLENQIDDLRAEAEAAETLNFDTSDLEDESKASEEFYRNLKEKEVDIIRAIEELKPATQVLHRNIEEISARNSKIAEDINSMEKK